MAEATVPSLPVEGEAMRSYAPSFVDRFTDWVRSLPIPAWLFYLALALALVLLHASIKWIDGSFPLGTFVWRLFLADITFPYALALLHYLDNSAQEALDSFHPIMQVEDAEFRRLWYQFTSLPARTTLIAAFIGGLYGLVA